MSTFFKRVMINRKKNDPDSKLNSLSISEIIDFLVSFSSNPPKQWKVPNIAGLDENDLKNLRQSSELSKEYLRVISQTQRFLGTYRKDVLLLIDKLSRQLSKTRKENKISELSKEVIKLRLENKELKSRG